MFTFNFDEKTTNIILTALGQMPYAQSAPVVQLIHEQYQSQMPNQKELDFGNEKEAVKG